jgi:DNA-binding transcriptional MerR regulator
MPAASKRKSRVQKSPGGEVVVPDKLYFRIGEVSRLCKLPAYVLRFWETEFSQLKPTKGSTGQRMYRRHEVECALRIKHLLYQEGFTIAGARQHLKAESKNGKSQSALPFSKPASSNARGLKEVRQGLKEVLGILSARR